MCPLELLLQKANSPVRSTSSKGPPFSLLWWKADLPLNLFLCFLCSPSQSYPPQGLKLRASLLFCSSSHLDQCCLILLQKSNRKPCSFADSASELCDLLPVLCVVFYWRLSLSFHPKVYHHLGGLQEPLLTMPIPGFSTPWHINLQWPSPPCHFGCPTPLLNLRLYRPKS